MKRPFKVTPVAISFRKRLQTTPSLRTLELSASCQAAPMVSAVTALEVTQESQRTPLSTWSLLKDRFFGAEESHAARIMLRSIEQRKLQRQCTEGLRDVCVRTPTSPLSSSFVVALTATEFSDTQNGDHFQRSFQLLLSGLRNTDEFSDAIHQLRRTVHWSLLPSVALNAIFAFKNDTFISVFGVRQVLRCIGDCGKRRGVTVRAKVDQLLRSLLECVHSPTVVAFSLTEKEELTIEILNLARFGTWQTTLWLRQFLVQSQALRGENTFAVKVHICILRNAYSLYEIRTCKNPSDQICEENMHRLDFLGASKSAIVDSSLIVGSAYRDFSQKKENVDANLCTAMREALQNGFLALYSLTSFQQILLLDGAVRGPSRTDFSRAPHWTVIAAYTELGHLDNAIATLHDLGTFCVANGQHSGVDLHDGELSTCIHRIAKAVGKQGTATQVRTFINAVLALRTAQIEIGELCSDIMCGVGERLRSYTNLLNISQTETLLRCVASVAPWLSLRCGLLVGEAAALTLRDPPRVLSIIHAYLHAYASPHRDLILLQSAFCAVHHGKILHALTIASTIPQKLQRLPVRALKRLKTEALKRNHPLLPQLDLVISAAPPAPLPSTHYKHTEQQRYLVSLESKPKEKASNSVFAPLPPSQRVTEIDFTCRTCLTCKLPQSIVQGRCLECGTADVPHQQCSKCFHINDPARDECHVCRASLESSIKLYSKEWRCNRCQLSNHCSSPVKCRGCSSFSGPLAEFVMKQPPQTCEHCQKKLRRAEPFCLGCGVVAKHALSSAHVWRCPSCDCFTPWISSNCWTCKHVPRTAHTATASWMASNKQCTDCHRVNLAPFIHFCRCGKEVPQMVAQEYLNEEKERQKTEKILLSEPKHCPGMILPPKAISFVVERTSQLPMWVCGGPTGCCTANLYVNSTCEKCLKPWDTASTAVVWSSWRCPTCNVTNEPEKFSLCCSECQNLHPKAAEPGMLSPEIIVRAIRMFPSITDTHKLLAVLKVITSAVLDHQHREWVSANSTFLIGAIAHSRSRKISDFESRELLALAQRVGNAIGFKLDLCPGKCTGCFGSHPSTLCPTLHPDGWKCKGCEHVNGNDGTRRFVCEECMEVRPELLDRPEWNEVWECPSCARCTPVTEDACLFCQHLLESDESEETLRLPLAPSRCGICCDIHFEALCPKCCTDNGSVKPRNIQKGSGVVCAIVPSEYAFIQPWGTSGKALRVYVPYNVLLSNEAAVQKIGQAVIFNAKVTPKGLCATSVSEDSVASADHGPL